MTRLPRQKHCSRCGASFTCGPERGQAQCWCDALPHIPPVAGQETDCLCPGCLRAAIAHVMETPPERAD